MSGCSMQFNQIPSDVHLDCSNRYFCNTSSNTEDLFLPVYLWAMRFKQVSKWDIAGSKDNFYVILPDISQLFSKEIAPCCILSEEKWKCLFFCSFANRVCILILYQRNKWKMLSWCHFFLTSLLEYNCFTMVC